ncbi:hypothetical protein [Phenylobacterium deserti]|uniref:Uncharacterized protein n=1 Tax=Phenylobacterium deserti TaxID=1914756 RepID=A0A328A8P9_9CAUL|nr:hypothetical protein [Phenylobacterium deserti]RAK50921.1 hypothetical protein DJ018_17295 [Phenylobacterium deserti]
MPIYKVKAFDEQGDFTCGCTIRAADLQTAQQKFGALPFRAASRAELWFGNTRLAARNLMQATRSEVRQRQPVPLAR